VNELWNQLAGRASIELSLLQHAQLDRYITLLLEANKRMNLTRIADRTAAELGHVADAMTLLPFLPPGPHWLADVGSGGGVPGIVLACLRTDATVYLIESTRKKADFLRETCRQLDLHHVTVVADRAEAAGRSELRDAFDIVTARAVGALAHLAEWCLPLVKKDGKFLAMKGAKITEELPEAETAIRLLSGDKAMVHPVELPGSEHRVIVEIKKIGKTPVLYPRDPTIAKGKAIGE